MRVDPARLPTAHDLARRARAWTVALVSLGGGMIGALIVESLTSAQRRPSWFEGAGLAALVSTTLLSAGVIALALRPTASLTSALKWSVAGGFLNFPVSTFFCMTALAYRGDEPPTEAFADWVQLSAYAIPGALVTVPMGFAFGLAYSPIVLAVRYQLERPALDLIDQVTMRVSVFLAFCGVLALGLAPDLRIAIAIAMTALVPLTLVSVWRIDARRRWLERVAAGEEPALRTVRACEADVPEDTLRLSPDSTLGHAVVRREDFPTYRTRPRALLLG